MIYSINIFLLLISMIFQDGADPLHLKISNLLSDYSWNHPDEKVYLHTDKQVYVAGEDLWLKAYLMIGPYHVPDTMSSVLYVELIGPDGRIHERKNLRMREGLGWGDFMLPSGLPPGQYMLKAYTYYMQNMDPAFHYRKLITLLPGPSSDQKTNGPGHEESLFPNENAGKDSIRLKFFPEGGNLVNGLQSHVTFKATGSSGMGKDIKGIISNAGKDTVAVINSRKFGMGLFTIKPEPGEVYTAEIEVEGKHYQYPLPQAMDSGYVMHINHIDNKIYLWVRNNKGWDMNNSFVIGQFRGFPFIAIHAKEDQDFLYTVLDTREIPSGIIHFTFFDDSGIPQCERLVYNENENERIKFDINSNKKTYKRREKAFFDIHCSDLSGNFILTNLSLSVVNSDLLKKNGNESTISSYFNLESDLKGPIEDPGYYVNPENDDRFEILDLLMLTQGWRRFTWKRLLNDQMPVFEYPAEQGFAIEGKLLDFYNQNKVRTGNVRLFIYENQLYYNEIETDENGIFSFQGLNIFDSTRVVLQAWQVVEKEGKRKDKTRNDFTFDIVSRAYADVLPDYRPFPDLVDNFHAGYRKLNEYILKIDSSFEGRTILLDEVTIRERKIDPEKAFERPGKLYKEPSRRIILDSLHTEEQSLMLFDLLRKYFPGIQFTGSPPNVGIMIRGLSSRQGNNSAMLFLDGLPVDNEFMYYFPASEIAFIDLLNANKATVLGSDAANGAIAFYTRQGPPRTIREERMGMINFSRKGYYRAREFYTPDYDAPEEKHAKPDFRRTLYWNPSLTTDNHGKIEFSFYTSDETAEYRVDIEGMTYNGIPFIHHYYFSVE
jgi:hypothetical protein